MSLAHQIALALTTRVQSITTANGYDTDIGSRVFRGRLSIMPEELPCAVIVEGEDKVEDQKRNGTDVKLAQPYIIEGHAACDADHPNDVAHQIIADLKRAIFSEPRLHPSIYSMRYVSRNIGARPEGAAIIAASIQIECVFSEDLSNP